MPDLRRGLEEPGPEQLRLLSLRAKSAGARVASHYSKSRHLANRGAFVGGGFSLCTSAAKLG